MADLLSFVQKYKMAAAPSMNCYLVTLVHPRSLLHSQKSVLKFHVNHYVLSDTWPFECFANLA